MPQPYNSWLPKPETSFVILLRTSFGDGGKVLTDFDGRSDEAHAIAVDENGKIVVAGSSGSAGKNDFALVRYTENGELDEDFGDGGKVLTSFTDDSEIDGETRLLAAGGEGDFTLARFDENGAPDPTFGTDGKVTGLFSSAIGSAYALAVTENGDAIVAGHDTNAFALARLDESGKKVATFGDRGGVVTALNPDNWSRAQGVALEADGKIVLGGWVYEGASSSGNFALARYTADGALDDGFGTDGGVVVTPIECPRCGCSSPAKRKAPIRTLPSRASGADAASRTPSPRREDRQSGARGGLSSDLAVELIHSFVELGVPAVQLARAWPPNIPDERVWPGWARGELDLELTLRFRRDWLERRHSRERG